MLMHLIEGEIIAIDDGRRTIRTIRITGIVDESRTKWKSSWIQISFDHGKMLLGSILQVIKHGAATKYFTDLGNLNLI